MTFQNVPAGYILAVQVLFIRAARTTAATLVVLI